MGERLKDKVAIITGSGSGIGRAIAIVMAREGAKIVTNNRAPTPTGDAEAVTREITEAGGTAVYAFADVSTMEGARKLVQTALDNFGTIDILVNSAGFFRDMPMSKMTESDFDEVVHSCLYGTFYCSKLASEHMVAQAKREKEEGKGIPCRKIINISSGSGIRGNPGQANYSAAKAGIIGLTKSNAKELARFNITVNTMVPFAWTRQTESMSDELKESFIKRIPLGRAGDLDKDIAPVAVFLASDDANYITGQNILCSGGLDM